MRKGHSKVHVMVGVDSPAVGMELLPVCAVGWPGSSIICLARGFARECGVNVEHWGLRQRGQKPSKAMLGSPRYLMAFTNNMDDNSLSTPYSLVVTASLPSGCRKAHVAQAVSIGQDGKGMSLCGVSPSAAGAIRMAKKAMAKFLPSGEDGISSLPGRTVLRRKNGDKSIAVHIMEVGILSGRMEEMDKTFRRALKVSDMAKKRADRLRAVLEAEEKDNYNMGAKGLREQSNQGAQ